MNTKSIPAIVMLLAGFIACLAGMKGHMEVSDFMKMLLFVLILFYVLGCVIKAVIDKNFVDIQEETTDGMESQEEEDFETEDDETTETEDEE